MNVLVVGLGLIGGSFAKSLKEKGHNVFFVDKDESVISLAKKEGLKPLENLKDIDLTFVCLYPKKTVEFVEDNALTFKKNSVVIDVCGVKRKVCERLFAVSNESGFVFIGGHPMAGTENSGFAFSRVDLFKGASMILTPENTLTKSLKSSIITEEELKTLILSLGFGEIKITTPDNHDKMIALTSQLAHVLSSAYVKSPQALKHGGFSAGSFKDMTRVAKLNGEMWTELFLQNGEYLTKEIDGLIERLTEYSQAIKDNDKDKLKNLLDEGTAIKKMTEGTNGND